MSTAAQKQFSFRLPEELVDRVEECVEGIRSRGLDLTRADVVRLLLDHALRTTDCRLDLLLRTSQTKGKKKKQS